MVKKMSNEMRCDHANAFMKDYCDGCSALEQGCRPFEGPICGTVMLLSDQPTVDAKPVVHGRWLDSLDESGKLVNCWRTCSVCGKQWSKRTNYCPNCGADMRERSEGE